MSGICGPVRAVKRETLVIMRLDDGKQESGNLGIVKVYIGDTTFLARCLF